MTCLSVSVFARSFRSNLWTENDSKMLPRNVFIALFCLLLFMQNLFLLHQQLVIVFVARIRLLWIWRFEKTLPSTFTFASLSICCEIWWPNDVWIPRKKGFSRLTTFYSPNLVDGIFEASLRLQKFWWVQKIVRTRNGFALTDFLANQTKFRVGRTGQANRRLTHLSSKTNFKGAVSLNEWMKERRTERTN